MQSTASFLGPVPFNFCKSYVLLQFGHATCSGRPPAPLSALVNTHHPMLAGEDLFKVCELHVKLTNLRREKAGSEEE